MRGYKNFESSPHPGDLKHLVEIGYTENKINENGYPEPQEVVVCKVWAAASGQRVQGEGDVVRGLDSFRE